MPSGHHRSPDRRERDRDRGKREWKEERGDSRERSRKYEDSAKHRESHRSDQQSSRDEEYVSSSSKKKSRKSEKLERISDDDSFDAAPSVKKSSKRESRKCSDDEEFLESIVSEKSHRDRHRDEYYEGSSSRKRKNESIESDRVKVEEAPKHNADEYEAVSDDNDHSLSPENSRRESKKKKRRDRSRERSDSHERHSYREDKRRSDLIAEGGRRVFMEYDDRESKKNKKYKYDDREESDSKHGNDRSHYSSRKRSKSPSEKRSKRSRRDEDEKEDHRDELNETEKQKHRREKAKDFIARQNELNSSIGEQETENSTEDKPLGSKWVSITPEKPASVKPEDLTHDHYDPMSPTKEESPARAGLYDGVDLSEKPESSRRRRSKDKRSSRSPSLQRKVSSRRSREKDRRSDKGDRIRDRSRSPSRSPIDKVPERKEVDKKVNNNDFYEDLPSVSPTDDSAFDFENANHESGRRRSKSRSRHRDRDYKRRYEYSENRDSRKRKSYHSSEAYDETDHRESSSKHQSSHHRSEIPSDDFKNNERERSPDHSTSGNYRSSLSPSGRFKIPGSPVDPKSKRRSHRDSNGVPTEELRHLIEKQKNDDNFDRRRRGSEERSRERPCKRLSESRDVKDDEKVEDDVKESFDLSSNYRGGSRKRGKSPDDNEIEVELPAIGPKFSVSELAHKPQQYSWPRPNDERVIGGLTSSNRVSLKEKFSAETIVEKYNLNRSASGSISINADVAKDACRKGGASVVSVREILEKYNGRATGARADMEIRDKIRKSSTSSVPISPSHPLFKNFKNLSRKFLVNSSETL